MNILSISVFYLVDICGLIGKICSLLHCKVYFNGFIHNFLVAIAIIRINISYSILYRVLVFLVM